MFAFLFKKWFYNSWDNLLRIVLYNVLFTGLILFLLFLFRTLSIQSRGGIIINWLLVAVLFGILYMAIAILSAQAWQMVKSKANLRDITVQAKALLKPGILYGLAQWTHISLLLIAIPFYNGINLFIGSIAIGILFWVSVAWLSVIQYFFPLLLQLSNPIKKTLRKSTILFFDNSFFSVSILLTGFGMLLVSVITIFMFPGITGILLWKQEATHLRLLKYDYLEQTGDKEKTIPWKDILAEEREKLGTRSFRNFIFPWKD